MKKIIIGLGVLIFIGITMVSWVASITMVLVLLTAASRIRTYESIRWLVTFPQVLYVTTIRHVLVLLTIICVGVPIYIIVTGNVLSPFNICIYMSAIICTLLGMDFCRRISKANVYTENGIKPLVLKPREKVLYTKLVLDSEENYKESIVHVPREEKYREVCVLYIDFKEKILREEDESWALFKNIAFSTSLGFSTLKFKYDVNALMAYKTEVVKEHIKSLKKEMNFEKVIIVSSGSDAMNSINLGLQNEYKKIDEQIDGIIALYPNMDIIKASKRSPDILMIYGSHNKTIDMKKGSKGISYLELPACGHSYDDFYSTSSIVGNKINKEIINWLSANFL